MGHLNGRRRNEATGISTPLPWLAAGANIADFCNARARRSDIVVYVGETTTANAAACFVPATAELEVNYPMCFEPGIDPEKLGDLEQRATRLEHPVASGVILHEASHARWTTWSLEKAAELGKTDERDGMLLVEAMHWLEESRIENLAVTAWPADREQLRSSALRLALLDMDTDDGSEHDLALAQPVELLKCACLAEARVVAGVIDASDITAVTAKLSDGLGAERLEAARQIFAQVHAINPADRPNALFDQMQTAARALLDLLTDEDRQAQADAAAAGQAAMQAMSDLLDELAGAADVAEAEARSEVAEQIKEMRDEASAKAAAKAAAERASDEAVAREVFGKSTGPAGGATYSEVVETRAPTGSERAMAVRLGRDLERINYSERMVTRVASMLPPGKLRARTAVLGAAQRSRGLVADAEPWVAKHRHHVDSAPLTAGVLVDISGSMSSAMEPMATAAWVLSEAVRRVQGTAAMVYFGSSVFSTLKPHQHLEKVTVYSAPDGTEEFEPAIKALNGALNLVDGEGARVLFVVSDGHYRTDQAKHVKKWVKRLTDAGVAVVWLPMDRITGSSVLSDKVVSDRVQIIHGKQSVKVMHDVGAAVVNVFKRAQSA